MAIGTNDLIDKFGTADVATAGGGTAAVLDGAFSAQADAAAWTNDEEAPEAEFELVCQFATVPANEKMIELHARLLNINGTNDAPQPDANYGAEYLGAFQIDAGSATATNMYLPIRGGTVPLKNQKVAQEYEFYIKNTTGQTISAGWVLTVKPKTVGPKPAP